MPDPTESRLLQCHVPDEHNPKLRGEDTVALDAESDAALISDEPGEAFRVDLKTEAAVKRNARRMKPAEYEWLKSQDFQPWIRRALVAEYERVHATGGSA